MGATLVANTLRRTGTRLARAWRTTPWPAAIVLFCVAAGIRFALATRMSFPPLGDAAYYISVARSLYQGHGFTIGNVWNYQPPPPSVVGPSNSYWGPLTSIVEWFSMLLFGNRLLAALVPDVLAGALLVALAYVCGRPVLAHWLNAIGAGKDADATAHWLALGAALLLAVDAEFTYQSVSGDSTMLYGVLGFAAIVLWNRALGGVPTANLTHWWDRQWGWSGASVAAWATGIFLAGAYLTRGSAIFLFVALGGWWCWLLMRELRRPGRPGRPGLRPLVGAAAAACVSAAVVLLPWLVRQQVVFGHAFTSEATHNALAFSLEDFFDYGASPTLATYLAHGLGPLLTLRLSAFTDIQRHVTDYAFYPSALPAVVGLCILTRRVRVAALGLANLALLVVGFAVVFPAVSLFGGYYHSLASVAPFLAWGEVALFYLAARWARRLLPLHVSLAPALAAIAILLQCALLGFAAPVVGATARGDQQTFADTARWLVAHHAHVVMATESTSLYYASGIPTVELPAAQSPDVAYTCARRYGAKYLVILRAGGLYPQVLGDQPSPHFVLVAHTSEYTIYQIIT